MALRPPVVQSASVSRSGDVLLLIVVSDGLEGLGPVGGDDQRVSRREHDLNGEGLGGTGGRQGQDGGDDR